MALDFGHTCPDIDKEIENIKEMFYSSIEGLLQQYNGVELSESDIKDIANDYKYNLYYDVEHCFEGVRRTNEQMRKEADCQIDNLSQEVNNLNNNIEDLTNDIDSKNDEIAALNSDIETLEENYTNSVSF